MRWTKFALLLQAVLVLIIGMLFLSKMLELEKQKVPDKINEAVDSIKDPGLKAFVELKYRFEKAAYILVMISLIEFIIIWRLVS